MWGGTLPPHFYVEGLVEVQSPNDWTTRRFPKWRDFHCGNATGLSRHPTLDWTPPFWYLPVCRKQALAPTLCPGGGGLSRHHTHKSQTFSCTPQPAFSLLKVAFWSIHLTHVSITQMILNLYSVFMSLLKF